MPGGEWAGRDRATAWLDGPLKTYGDGRDLLASDETSRLSAYLRFGCVSPLALARAALPRPGGEEFCRQLAWRDFFHQVTAAFPDIATEDYRPGPHGTRNWAEDPDALERTIRAWLDNLERNFTAVEAIIGVERARLWRLYLAGGALAFEEGRMGVDQILAARPG